MIAVTAVTFFNLVRKRSETWLFLGLVSLPFWGVVRFLFWLLGRTRFFWVEAVDTASGEKRRGLENVDFVGSWNFVFVYIALSSLFPPSRFRQESFLKKP